MVGCVPLMIALWNATIFSFCSISVNISCSAAVKERSAFGAISAAFDLSLFKMAGFEKIDVGRI